MAHQPGRARELDQALPPPLWGIDLGEAEREVRRTLREVPFARARSPAITLGHTVPLLRPLVRLGLFSRADNPPPTTGLHLEVPNGQLYVAGARLSWRELRVFSVIAAVAKEHDGRLRELYLPPSRLASYTSATKNAGHVAKARASLERLCDARLSFTLTGFGQVGTPQRPERILTRDPHDDDLYHLRPWLAELLRSGLDRSQRNALVESHVAWPVLCALWRAPLLLYAYLEAENWPANGLHPDPANPHGPQVHVRELYLEAPLLRVLDLHELHPEAKRLEAVRRAMRLIVGRDWRYRGWKLQRIGAQKVPMLRVWRRPDRPSPALVWTGPVCARCKRPDPQGACCCDRPLAQRCGQRACPRCSERR